MWYLAAVPLLAKHEQKPPSAEQPFSECRGGEKQGNVSCGDLFVSYLTIFIISAVSVVIILANLAC